MISRSLLVAACAALMLPLASAAHADANVDQAKQYVQSVGDDSLAIVKNKKQSKAAKQKSLESLLSKSVDMPWVARFVMGRYWKQATEAQKTRYVKEYERFILSNYSARFMEYTGEGFKITDARADGENQYVVNMLVKSSDGGADVGVEYRVRQSDGGKMKIYDVIIEGISMITTQRSEFASVINDEGIDALITKLANKSIKAPELQAKK